MRHWSTRTKEFPLLGLVPLVLLLAAAPGSSLSVPALSWSDPIPIADTPIAVPPATVALGDTVQILWVTRQGNQSELWHAAVSSKGTVIIRPHKVAGDVDTRLSRPVAAAVGGRLVAAWMSRSHDGVRLQVGMWRPDGNPARGVLSPRPAFAEEGGRIAILERRGSIHLAWSEFDGDARRIWYVRLSPDGKVVAPARALAEGDAPALAGGERLRLLWWASVGFDTYRLMAGEIGGSRLGDPVPLTGTVLLGSPLPPIPLPADGILDVLVPTIERGFGTAGYLYLITVRGSATARRIPLVEGMPLADVTGEGGLVVWSQPAGRRQNSEIYAAIYDRLVGRFRVPARVTYTIPGSLRPAVTVVGGTPAAAWLETRGVARFQVVAATTATPRPRRFLLGIPELDLSRPGALLAFAVTATATVLPYAALFAALFSLVAGASSLLATLVVGGFPSWRRVLGGPGRRMALFCLLIVLLEIVVRGLIPGRPSPRFLLLSMVGPAAIAVAFLTRRKEASGMTFLLAGEALLALQLLVVLFPWGALQLSQY